MALLSLVVLGLITFASCSRPAAQPANAPPATSTKVSFADRIDKVQKIAESERLEQLEQIALSEDWTLKFPPNVQENELAGVIVDSDGHPIRGALVDFFPAVTGQETTTDEQGMFRYRFPDAGRNAVFEVRFSKEGFSSIYRRQQTLGVKDFR